MIEAARKGHRDIVNLMLHRGATAYDGAMIAAADGGHPEMTAYLREYQRLHLH